MTFWLGSGGYLEINHEKRPLSSVATTPQPASMDVSSPKVLTD